MLPHASSNHRLLKLATVAMQREQMLSTSKSGPSTCGTLHKAQENTAVDAQNKVKLKKDRECVGTSSETVSTNFLQFSRALDANRSPQIRAGPTKSAGDYYTVIKQEYDSSSDFSDQVDDDPISSGCDDSDADSGSKIPTGLDNKSSGSNLSSQESKEEAAIAFKHNTPAFASSATECQPSTSENSLAASVPSAEGGKKKRLVRRSKWKKEVAKHLRNTGKEYVSSTKKVIQERKILPPCASNCRLNCSSKFTDNRRIEIFDGYWKLGNIEKQRAFIAQNIESVNPRYRYCVNPDKHRQLNHAFFLHNGDQKVRVCKLFFKNTLGINDRPIRTVLAKKIKGITVEDRRGKHEHHKKVDPKIKDSVREHINSLPRKEGHHLHANTPREYIARDKTIAGLYREYEKMQADKGEPAASLMMYSRIFNGGFNISSPTHEKDVSNVCESFENEADNEELKKEAEEDEDEEELILS